MVTNVLPIVDQCSLLLLTNRKAILTEQPKLSGSAWADISDQAKDFVSSILVKYDVVP